MIRLVSEPVTDLRPARPPRRRDRVGWRSVATAVLWLLAVAACAHLVLRSYTDDRYAIDFHVLQDGATRFWDGGSVYSDPWFLLTPSGLLAMLPFGLVGPGVGFAVWNTVSICAVAVGIVCSLRFVGAPLAGPVAAATTLVVCLSESFTSTLMPRDRAPDRWTRVTTERGAECWLTDMDGVLVHEEKALPGAAEFLERLVEQRAPLPGADQQLDLHPARPGRPAGPHRACTCRRSRSGPRRWRPRTSWPPSCPAARPTSSARRA